MALCWGWVTWTSTGYLCRVVQTRKSRQPLLPCSCVESIVTSCWIQVWAPEQDRQQLLLYPWFVQVAELAQWSGWVRAVTSSENDLIVGEDSGLITVIRFQLTKEFVSVKTRGARKIQVCNVGSVCSIGSACCVGAAST